MKDQYLKELEDLLNENNVPNKEEILEKYRKRYEFGLESEMTEDEIEEMLGKPSDVISKYIKNEEATKNEQNSNCDIIVRTVADDIKLDYSSDEKAHVQLYDIDKESYNIVVSSSEIRVEYKTNKYLGLNRRKSGKITVLVPEGRLLHDVTIETASGDAESYLNIDANNVAVNTVSGDIEFDKIKSRQLNINVVSGDIEIIKVDSGKVIINTVSGDIDIDTLYADKLVIDSVSGDCKITNSNTENVVSNFISGDFIINGVEQSNFSKKIKEATKKNKK